MLCCVCVTRANACLDLRGVSEGGVPPQKLEDSVFLETGIMQLGEYFLAQI